jgi:hypothetical protein
VTASSAPPGRTTYLHERVDLVFWRGATFAFTGSFQIRSVNSGAREIMFLSSQDNEDKVI